MIDIEKNDLFENSKSTLRKTSMDGPGGSNAKQYMSESDLEVYDFDKIKRKHTGALHVSHPKSSDAFYINKTQSEMFLIEFKNGRLGKIGQCDSCKREFYGKREVWIKIFDSLLILAELLSISISDARNKLGYILVYNDDKNPLSEEGTEAIGKYVIGDRGEDKFVVFGLGRFEKLYFKSVHTVTKDEFKKNFSDNWEKELMI